MIYGLYLSAGGLQAQQQKQTVLANNLANAQTNGFKRDLVNMRARANAVDEDVNMARFRMAGGPAQDLSGGVLATSGGIDLSQSMMETTGSPTDFALNGPGFFVVAGDKPGEKLLTRDGRFSVNDAGNLVSVAGNRKLLGPDGQPVQIKAGVAMSVDGQGRIYQDGNNNAQMAIADVKNPGSLMKLGDNLLTGGDASNLTAAPKTEILQGKLETSGVDPISEMVNMMEGQRAFDANAKMITMQDQTLSQLNTIARVA